MQPHPLRLLSKLKAAAAQSEQLNSGSVGPFSSRWARDNIDNSCTACPAGYAHTPSPERPRLCTYSDSTLKQVYPIDGIPCGEDVGLSSTWEGNLRMPALVRWPGKVRAGSVSFEAVNTMDLFASCLELAGIPLPTDRVIDSKSLLPVIQERAPSPHDFMFHWRDDCPSCVPPRLYAVRKGPWKAHFITRSAKGPDTPVDQDPPILFHLGDDPEERYPVNVTEHAEVMAAIASAAEANRASIEWTRPLCAATDPALWPCANPDNHCRT